jgi:hypothetical protein
MVNIVLTQICFKGVAMCRNMEEVMAVPSYQTVQQEAHNSEIEPALGLRIRIPIRRIRMFFGLPDPDLDPLVRGADPDPSLFS